MNLEKVKFGALTPHRCKIGDTGYRVPWCDDKSSMLRRLSNFGKLLLSLLRQLGVDSCKGSPKSRPNWLMNRRCLRFTVVITDKSSSKQVVEGSKHLML